MQAKRELGMIVPRYTNPFVHTGGPGVLLPPMNEQNAPRRRVPWVVLLVAMAIVLAIVAFGLFKRKGGRKPPPIPDQTSDRQDTLPAEPSAHQRGDI